MREKLATGGVLGGGALGTALVLATGCLGAKALVLLGISSGALGGLSALEPYRPLLLVVSGAALAGGLWQLVRRRRTGPPAGFWRKPTSPEVQ